MFCSCGFPTANTANFDCLDLSGPPCNDNIYTRKAGAEGEVTSLRLVGEVGGPGSWVRTGGRVRDYKTVIHRGSK